MEGMMQLEGYGEIPEHVVDSVHSETSHHNVVADLKFSFAMHLAAHPTVLGCTFLTQHWRPMFPKMALAV